MKDQVSKAELQKAWEAKKKSLPDKPVIRKLSLSAAAPLPEKTEPVKNCYKCGGKLEHVSYFPRAFCAKCSCEVAQIQAEQAQKEAQQEGERQAAALREQRLNELMSILPPCYRECRLDNFRPPTKEAEQVLSACRSFVDDFEINRARGTSLLFEGNLGTGKGHLAAAVLYECVSRHRVSAVFEGWIEIVSKIKATWRPGSERTEDQVFDRYRKVDLCVIDEIGVQFDTAAEKVLLYRLYNHRHEYCLPTILTTNCKKQELEQYITPRLIDRLFDTTRGNQIFHFGWQSYRRG